MINNLLIKELTIKINPLRKEGFRKVREGEERSPPQSSGRQKTTKKTMLNNKLIIIQHNVRKWSTNRHSVTNAYLKENPHIILINSHGAKNTEEIKIVNYNIHQKTHQTRCIME